MKVDDKLLKKSVDTAIKSSVMKKEGHKDRVRKFDETIDFVMNLKDLNLNDPKQRIDKEVVLPNGIIASDKPSICVIASDEILLVAKNLGLDTMDEEALIKLNNQEKKYKKKFVKRYEYFIVEDKMMPNVARYLARFLGPLGKMPKPFPSGYGIISNPDELKVAVERYSKVIRIQLRKQPLIQVKLGKRSMDKQKVFENLKAVIDYVADQMPHKYNNIKSMYIKTTMGQPVKIDEDFLKTVEVR
jgi:large subunit ribosomal protein L1